MHTAQPTNAPARPVRIPQQCGNSFPRSNRLFKPAPWLRHLANAIPAFVLGLFAILSAAPSNAATPAQPLVAAGPSHSLYVTSDGKLWAMGANSSGQLGDGTTVTRALPVQVATNVIAVAAGGHSLYVTSDGKLWAMGDNYCGQLGDGTTTNRTSPVPVTTSTNVIAVAAGGRHSLYVTSDGKLWAMGYNGYGQLGVSDTTDRTSPVQVATNVIAVAANDDCSLFITSGGKLWAMGEDYGTTPVQVEDSSGVPVTDVIAVAASGLLNHSLFVKSDGTLWAIEYDMTPKQVMISPGVPATNVIAVTTGIVHSLYVTSDGKLWAMGWNRDGQLGIGSDGINVDINTPQQVNVPDGLPVIAAAAGFWHSLYMTSDGKIWAMGNNEYGQLGDGSTVTRAAPVQVATNVITVAAGGGNGGDGGNGHSLYVTGDGKLWAMGANGCGQLGVGDTIAWHFSPVQVATNVIAVATGDNHSLYVTSGGNLWAMGYNYYNVYTSPVQVKDDLGVPVTNVIAVTAGYSYSLYVTSDGKLWAMESGFGTIPVQVKYSSGVTVTNVIAVAAGGYHSLFVTSDGSLWAMGNNSSGQLGDGTTTTRTSPVRVATNVIAVATCGSHSLYVTSDGKLWAMGWNKSGALGDGTSTDRIWPVQVMVSPSVPATNVIAVAAGGNDFYGDEGHSLYVTSDGKLWAMGANGYGQLGDGTTTARYRPVQVATNTNVIAVAAGRWHSLYLTSDSKLWAMGSNKHGQLGDGTITMRHTPLLVGTVNALPLTVVNGTGSSTYAVGATVTITANPAPSGKVFDRWTTSNGGTFGDATTPTTTFTMPATATTVTAIYKDQSTGGGNNGGGGGATSLWLLIAATALLALRRLTRNPPDALRAR